MKHFYDKKSGWFLLCRMLLLCLALSCLPAKADAAPFRLGLVFPSYRESRWESDLQSFQQLADQYGFSILVRFANNDQTQQNQHIQELVTLGVDALVVVPEDVFKVAEGIKSAKERDTYIIAYDRLPQGCPVDAYITFSSENVGKLMGEHLLRYAPTGNYVVITPPSADNNSAQISKGLWQVLQPAVDKKQIHILAREETPAWAASASRKIMEDVLQKYPNTPISGVAAPNDDTAQGVFEALDAAGITDKIILTGQDAVPAALNRVYAGEQTMTVFKDTRKLAALTVQHVLHKMDELPLKESTITNNGMLDVPTFYAPILLVEKETLRWMLRVPEYP